MSTIQTAFLARVTKLVPHWIAYAGIFIVSYAGFLYLLEPQHSVQVNRVPFQMYRHSAQATVFTSPQRAVGKQVSLVITQEQSSSSVSAEAETSPIDDSSSADGNVIERKAGVKINQANILRNTQNPDATIRRVAVMNLTSVPYDDALSPLRDALNDPSKKVRTSALVTLPKLAVADFTKADEVLAMISPALADTDPAVVRAAQNAYQAVVQVKREHDR